MELWARFFPFRPGRGKVNNDHDSMRFARFRGRSKKNHVKDKDELRIADLRFVVLDTETTGFKPHDGDEIISVGAVVVRGGVMLEEKFHRLVNPHREIPPLITDLTGISNDMVAAADDFCDVVEDFLDFLGDSVIVGHCIDFDMNFLNIKLKPYKFGINNYYLDLVILSKILNTDLRCHTLDDMLCHMGVDPCGRHTALGDALLTAHLWLQFLDRLDQLKIKTLWDLRTFIRHSMLYIS